MLSVHFHVINFFLKLVFWGVKCDSHISSFFAEVIKKMAHFENFYIDIFVYPEY